MVIISRGIRAECQEDQLLTQSLLQRVMSYSSYSTNHNNYYDDNAVWETGSGLGGGGKSGPLWWEDSTGEEWLHYMTDPLYENICKHSD